MIHSRSLHLHRRDIPRVEAQLSRPGDNHAFPALLYYQGPGDAVELVEDGVLTGHIRGEFDDLYLPGPHVETVGIFGSEGLSHIVSMATRSTITSGDEPPCGAMPSERSNTLPACSK